MLVTGVPLQPALSYKERERSPQCVRHRNVRQSYVAGVGYCHLIRENIAYLDLKPLVLDPFHRLAIACDGIKAFFHRQGWRILGGMERYDMVIIWIQ